MKPKHTPGPWTAEESESCFFVGSDEFTVCRMDKPVDDLDSISTIETAANARLIAAAPEMFEALTWLSAYLKRNTLGTVPLEHGIGVVVDAHLLKLKIESALASARGDK